MSMSGSVSPTGGVGGAADVYEDKHSDVDSDYCFGGDDDAGSACVGDDDSGSEPEFVAEERRALIAAMKAFNHAMETPAWKDTSSELTTSRKVRNIQWVADKHVHVDDSSGTQRDVVSVRIHVAHRPNMMQVAPDQVADLEYWVRLPKDFKSKEITEQMDKHLLAAQKEMELKATLVPERGLYIPQREDRSVPSKDIVFSAESTDGGGSAASAATQGEVKATFSAVYDGHLGFLCADTAEHTFHHCVVQRFNHFIAKGCPHDWSMYYAMKLAGVDFTGRYLNRSDVIKVGEASSDFSRDISGSTANFAVECKGAVWVGNIGDSGALLVTNKGKIRNLSVDQNLIWREGEKTEARSPVKRGNTISKRHVNSVVLPPNTPGGMPFETEVTHALGDRGCLSSRARVVRVSRESLGLQPDEKAYLVQFSDGMTKKFTKTEIGEIVCEHLKRQLPPDKIPEALLLQAQQTSGLNDDRTVQMREVLQMQGSRDGQDPKASTSGGGAAAASAADAAST